jgi:hypothetical protein
MTRVIARACSLLTVFLAATALGQEPVHKETPKAAPAPDPQNALKVVDLGKGVSVTQHGRGKLLVRKDSWDFGHVPQDAKITHEFILENSASDTLFIEEVKPTCGCTTAPLTKDRLSPGEKLPLAVTFSSGKHSGNFNKAVHVISSDPDQTLYPLQFHAEVADSTMEALPSGTVINLDRVAAGESRSATLALTNLATGNVTVSIADPPPAFLKASLSSTSLASRQSVNLKVVTTGEPPVGQFNGSVTVEMAGTENTRYTIPITGIGLMK